jgi:hypothetical protein
MWNWTGLVGGVYLTGHGMLEVFATGNPFGWVLLIGGPIIFGYCASAIYHRVTEA